MSFHLHYSLVHATKVLKLIRKKLKGAKCDITVECWANCREQGFYLRRNESSDSDTRLALVFAQQRNSDSIVVVYGTPMNFDITTNAPDEEVWEKNRKNIATDEEATKYIVDLLAFYPMKELTKPCPATK